MSRDLSLLVCTMLHALLDRYEQPQRQTVVRVRLNERDHAAYFSAESAAPRAAQHAALHELLLFQPAHADWHAAFLDWARTQLDQHRSVAPLDLDHERWNRDLLRALAALATLNEPTLERTLSVRLFGNSKRLHELWSAIITVLRRHDSTAAAYADDPDALLRSHDLDRVPEHVPLAGPLVLPLGGDQLEARRFSCRTRRSRAVRAERGALGGAAAARNRGAVRGDGSCQR